METDYNTNDCYKEYQFKSYYVVWKLKKSNNNSDWLVRLNRTM